MEKKTQKILRHLVIHEGANLCPKCIKIRLTAGLRPDPLGGELKRVLRPSNRNQGALLLSALKKSLFANLPPPLKFNARSALEAKKIGLNWCDRVRPIKKLTH